MGIPERRAIKHFEEQDFPELKTQIDAAAGFEIPVEVDWTTLAVEDYSHLYAEALPKVYFEPLIQALQAIAVDDLGKDALKAGLKKVVIQGGEKSFLEYTTLFSEGVLTIAHNPVTNIDDVAERKKAIQTALEKAL